MQPGARTIKGVGTGSLARVAAVQWLLAGALEGVLVALGCLLIAAIAGAQGNAEQVGGFLFLAVVSFVGLPVVGLIGGFFAGLIGAFCFNLACRLTGGIEIDVE